MRSTTARTATAAGALLLMAQLLPVATTVAADPFSQTFSYSGDEQQFVVPAGVTRIHVALIGAKGGNNTDATAFGGPGSVVDGVLNVTPGQVLFVEVGGNGTNAAGGFNGGGNPGSAQAGGGGGASDLRTIGRASAGTLASRLVIAAGGGGGGGGFNGAHGGPGDTNGVSSCCGGFAGQAGSDVGGGNGGAGSVVGGSAGTPGSSGNGGPGGAPLGLAFGGGGGGGGYFGGGGGGGGGNTGTVSSGHGGGGGGGSSLTTNLFDATIDRDETGVAKITISDAPIDDDGTVGATVDVPTSAACLQLSTSSIAFGTLSFGAQSQPATPTVTVTNCSASQARLLASGTNATGMETTGQEATWILVSGSETCADTLGLDRYRLELAAAEWLGDSQLGTLPAFFTDLAAGQSSEQTVKITMPCPGSSGGGLTMSMSVNYLAVAP
ncbi:MAG TPA: hypothetical protein VFV72_02150 [Candidatus Limnocylindrales bacterium]|nr:hypothetical protein [Candidatus Limnocylindrales bacterium]